MGSLRHAASESVSAPAVGGAARVRASMRPVSALAAQARAIPPISKEPPGLPRQPDAPSRRPQPLCCGTARGATLCALFEVLRW
jgi:hypothetical protein